VAGSSGTAAPGADVAQASGPAPGQATGAGLARLPDADLVRAALQNQKNAIAELITRHWVTAVGLAARVLGSADLAQDAAQEASIAAMLGLDRLRTPDRFGAWYCGITLNVARRWLRHLRAELPSSSVDDASTEAGPDEQVEAAEIAATVRDAVSQLAPGQRDAVFLFYLQGLTHREVAAELAISVGAVKARLHQARAVLRPRLIPLLTAPEKENVMTASAAAPAWTDVSVAEIRRSEGDDPARVHVLVLAEQDGTRQLPIWVGPAEATALALSLEAQEMPRPLTYQMAARLVEAAGSRVTEVKINRLAESIFYAVIAVDGPAGPQEFDARPSDAINLAVVTGAAIRVNPALLDLPPTIEHPDWREFPTSAADLAREARQQATEILRRKDR
jgi:RNA polymerase sigma factor (sigma-70 family)